VLNFRSSLSSLHHRALSSLPSSSSADSWSRPISASWQTSTHCCPVRILDRLAPVLFFVSASWIPWVTPRSGMGGTPCCPNLAGCPVFDLLGHAPIRHGRLRSRRPRPSSPVSPHRPSRCRSPAPCHHRRTPGIGSARPDLAGSLLDFTGFALARLNFAGFCSCTSDCEG
jgi:hypothetical protein